MNASLPTPFQTISTTSGGSAFGRTAVGTGAPLRISGCGRSYPIRRATVGAMLSRPVPGGISPGLTPWPNHTMGTLFCSAVSGAWGHAASELPAVPPVMSAPLVAAMTSGE